MDARGEAPADPAVHSAAHLALRGLGLERDGRWLFRELDLALARGEFLAVVGPSGVGKSSLLACLAGLLHPSEGRVLYDGPTGPRAPEAMRGRLGLVFQDLRLVPTSTLLDNVRCGRLGRHHWWATAIGLPERERAEAYRLLQALGLGAQALRWASEASGGEQQRAAIARALFLEPEVVIADEPVSALDADGAARALELLRQEAGRRGATLVCVLHDRPLVTQFADRVLTLAPEAPGGWRLGPVRAAPASS